MITFFFNFWLFLCNTYFILLSVEATNFDLFKSYLKNNNYVIHFNQNGKFADDCIVIGKKFEIILLLSFSSSGTLEQTMKERKPGLIQSD